MRVWRAFLGFQFLATFISFSLSASVVSNAPSLVIPDLRSQCLAKLEQIVAVGTGIVPHEELNIWSRRLGYYLRNEAPDGRDLRFNLIPTPEAIPHFNWMIEALGRRRPLVEAWIKGGKFVNAFYDHPNAQDAVLPFIDAVSETLRSFTVRVPSYRESLRLSELWLAAMEMPFQNFVGNFLEEVALDDLHQTYSEKNYQRFVSQYLSSTPMPSIHSMYPMQRDELSSPIYSHWLSRGNGSFQYFADLATPSFTLGIVEELPDYDGLKPVDFRTRPWRNEVLWSSSDSKNGGGTTFTTQTPFSDHIGNFWNHDFTHGAFLAFNDLRLKNAKEGHNMPRFHELLGDVCWRVKFARDRRRELERLDSAAVGTRDQIHFIPTHEAPYASEVYRLPRFYLTWLGEGPNEQTRENLVFDAYDRRAKPGDLGPPSLDESGTRAAIRQEREFWRAADEELKGAAP